MELNFLLQIIPSHPAIDKRALLWILRMPAQKFFQTSKIETNVVAHPNLACCSLETSIEKCCR